MPRSRLPFDGLLQSRRHAEVQEQRRVATHERERLALEDRMDDVRRAIAASRAAMRDALTGVVDAQMLRLHAASINVRLQEQARLLTELAALHKRLRSARQSLTEASRARRAIELMRERYVRRWHVLIAKTDAEALDHLAIRPGTHGAGTGVSF